MRVDHSSGPIPMTQEFSGRANALPRFKPLCRRKMGNARNAPAQNDLGFRTSSLPLSSGIGSFNRKPQLPAGRSSTGGRPGGGWQQMDVTLYDNFTSSIFISNDARGITKELVRLSCAECRPSGPVVPRPTRRMARHRAEKPQDAREGRG